MAQYLDTASAVSDQLFGPESAIPWWAWIAVLIAVFWKLLVPERQTARESAEERDTAMLAGLFEEENGGKKGKKDKKK
jgi:cyanate permease